MKKKEEKRYFDKEWQDMKRRLKAFLKNEKQEDLHRFRVQVKKIRAFLILSGSLNQRPELNKFFKPVRQMFKQAGEIRNAYINQRLGKSYQTGTNIFLSNQHQLQVKAGREFRSAGDKHIRRLRNAYAALEREIKTISDLHTNLFYQKLLHQIAGTFANLKFNEQLHACRKQVKLLIYNYKLTGKILIAGFNEAYLEQVQTAIGDWHDNVLAIELFSDNEIGDKKVVAALKKQAANLKKDVRALTGDFYNRATTVIDVSIEQLS